MWILHVLSALSLYSQVLILNCFLTQCGWVYFNVLKWNVLYVYLIYSISIVLISWLWLFADRFDYSRAHIDLFNWSQSRWCNWRRGSLGHRVKSLCHWLCLWWLVTCELSPCTNVSVFLLSAYTWGRSCTEMLCIKVPVWASEDSVRVSIIFLSASTLPTHLYQRLLRCARDFGCWK